MERKDSINSDTLMSPDDNSDFICSICLGIPDLFTAVEEVNCGKIFCKKCMEDLLKKVGSKCPNCREVPKLRTLKTENKIVYRYFSNLKIKCPNNCSWTGKYIDFIENHLLTCPNMEHECKYKKLGCIFKGSNTALKSHEEKECQNHLKLAIDYIDKLEKNKSKKIVFCLNKKYKVSCHTHELVAVSQPLRWNCDGRHLPGGCASGINNFTQTAGMEEFRCQACDYDLCHACLEKYFIE